MKIKPNTTRKRQVQLKALRSRVSGALPPKLFSESGPLSVIDLCENLLVGRLPSSIGIATKLRLFHVRINALSGSLPPAFGHLRQLVDFFIGHNRVSGSIPQAVCSPTLSELELHWNEISGTVPDAYGRFRHFNAVHLSMNKLSGSIPRAICKLKSCIQMRLAGNKLTGTLPMCLRGLGQLTGLAVNFNKLAGSIPDRITHMHGLQDFLRLEENHLTGTIPGGFRDLKSLLVFSCGRNLFEGSVPGALFKMRNIRFLSLAGEPRRPGRLIGSLSAVHRMKNLEAISMQWQRFRGTIPSFGETILKHIVLHSNQFERLPNLNVRKEAQHLLFHRNRLSCRLPVDEQPHPHLRLVLAALGNHLSRPTTDHPTSWILRYEQNSLFWISDGAALWYLLKALAGFLLFCWAFKRQVGRRTFMMMLAWWESCPEHQNLIEATRSLLSCTICHALGSCLLIMPILQSNHYICRDALTLASACLLKTRSVQVMVVILWSLFISASVQPWWCGRSQFSRRKQRRTRVRSSICWACWISLLLLVSCPTLLDIMAASVPHFLQMHSHWVRLLHVGVGGYQALASGVLIPGLAGLAVGIRKPTLISIACALSSWLLPLMTVLILDWECYDQWGRLWPPCAQPGKFDVSLPRPSFDRVQEIKLAVLHHGDVCGVRAELSYAACARSMALKLQDMLISKFTMTAILLPAARLATGHRLYKRTDQLAQGLALILELGMLWGPSLPLLAPFLPLAVVSQKVVAVVSVWGRGGLKDNAMHGDAAIAVALAGACSLLHHRCFVSEDVTALYILWLVVLIVPMKEQCKRSAPQDEIGP